MRVLQVPLASLLLRLIALPESIQLLIFGTAELLDFLSTYKGGHKGAGKGVRIPPPPKHHAKRVRYLRRDIAEICENDSELAGKLWSVFDRSINGAIAQSKQRGTQLEHDKVVREVDECPLVCVVKSPTHLVDCATLLIELNELVVVQIIKIFVVFLDASFLGHLDWHAATSRISTYRASLGSGVVWGVVASMHRVLPNRILNFVHVVTCHFGTPAVFFEFAKHRCSFKCVLMLCAKRQNYGAHVRQICLSYTKHDK